MRLRTAFASLLLLTLPDIASAQSARLEDAVYSPHWRQDVQEMIEDGRTTEATILLEEAARRQSYLTDPIERVNQARYVGEGFARLGRGDLARERFDAAMKEALPLKPVWKALSAAISVLEIQAETKDEPGAQALLQQTLDAKLLPEIAKDRHATEIGRFVQRFALASRAQIYALVEQIRKMDNSGVRKKALFALTEIDMNAPFTGEGKYDTAGLPVGVDDLERFLWFAVYTDYYAESGLRFVFDTTRQELNKAYERLNESQREQYRDIFRKAVRLKVEKPIPSEPEAEAPNGAKTIRFDVPEAAPEGEAEPFTGVDWDAKQVEDTPLDLPDLSSNPGKAGAYDNPLLYPDEEN